MTNCDRYRTSTQRREEYRQRQLRRTEGKVVTIGRDGRRTVHKEVTSVCQRCTKEFTYVMTTKPRKFHPECYVLNEREKKRAADKARAGKREAAQPPIRLIPYVGFDPTEKPLDYKGELHD